jgi:hypothetical protein
MSISRPIEILRAGAVVLNPVLQPHGFMFRDGASGTSSGGSFASGTFERGNRAIEFHFRYGLGLVTYRIGASTIDHENYLRFAGHWAAHEYPSFGASPDESFSALAHDLSAFFSDFLAGTGDYFKEIVNAHAANPNKFKGFAALSNK